MNVKLCVVRVLEYLDAQKKFWSSVPEGDHYGSVLLQRGSIFPSKPKVSYLKNLTIVHEGD